MTILSKTSLALAIALAASGPCDANAGGDPQPMSAARHSALDFKKAKAMAPPAPIFLMESVRADHRPETDGLSRNDEDCNFGCIDH
jgi:hypothetical protein